MAAFNRSDTALSVAASSHSRGDRLRGLNDQLGWLMLIIVCGSAVPLGSARPFFWALLAGLASVAALYYAIQLERTNSPLRHSPIRLPATLGFGLVCLYLVLQCLPVQAIVELAGQISTADGRQLNLPHLSLAPGNTMLMLLQMLTYGLVLWLVSLVGVNRRRRLRLLGALFFFIAAHAAFAIVALTQLGDTVLIFPKWAYEGVATGTFVNRNSFATYLAIGLVLGTGMTLDELVYRSRSDRLTRAKDQTRPPRSVALYAAGLLVVVAALLATQSRMGVAVGALGVLLVSIPFVAALPLNRNWRLAALALLGAVVSGLVFSYGQGFIERLGSVEASTDVRLDLYRQVVDMIAARPWFGYGGAAFEVAFPLFHQLPVSPDLTWNKAHNTYLALWVELGVVIGSIPILMLLDFAVRLLRSSIATPDRVAQLVALASLVLVAAHSYVDFSLEIEANALLLVMVVGSGLAATVSDARVGRPGEAADK